MKKPNSPDSAPDSASNVETPLPPELSISQEPMDTAVLDSETANAAQSQGDSTGKQVARATSGIMPLQIARLLMGFVAQPLMARIFGLRWEADVYTVAANIQEKLWLLFEKVVNPSVLPCFMGALHEDSEERAWRFASSVIWMTVLALCVITPLAWFLMPNIVGIYSIKTAAFPERMALAVSVARLLLSGLFFLGLSSLTYVLLNGYKRFAVAALGDALWKAGILGGVTAAIALKAAPKDALTIISLGFIAGAFLKIFPHLLGLRSKWRLLQFRIDTRDPMTRKMMLLAIPLVIGILISESRDVYLLRLADHDKIGIEAGRTAWKFSRLIGSNLIQIFPYAISIGIFPYLADLARTRQTQELTDTLLGALRVCVFTFLPLTVILIALRLPILRAVWESGSFTLDDSLKITGPFTFYTLGLIAFSCEMMLNQTYYAMTNAWTPMLIGVTTSALWAGIATWGVASGYGLAAITGAEAVSKSVKCLLLWLLLRPKLGDVHLKESALFAFKVLLGALLAAMAAGFVIRFITPDTHAAHFKIKMLLSVAAAGGLGVVVFVIFAALTGIREVQQVLAFGGKIRRRFAR